MSLPPSSSPALASSITDSPELYATPITRSASISTVSSDEVTLAGDEHSPKERPLRFRSASLAIDAAVASFNSYRKGKNKRKKDDRILSLNTEMGYIATMSSPMSSGMEGSMMSLCQYGRRSVFEGLPELLKVLQDVATIHPFLAVAVGAFKIAIELDIKRRENDKKIDLLFLEMRDMMGALVQLCDIQDGPEHVGRDGKTLQEKLEVHTDQMYQDIIACANACDAYAKKRTMSRVFQGFKWDEIFKEYIRRFNQCRANIEFTLAIYLGTNVDAALRKLNNLDEKIEQVVELLHQSLSPEQRDLTAQIQRRGGPSAILADDQLLASLSRGRYGSSMSTPTGKLPTRQGSADLEALKADMIDEPEIAIANNMETFERKFKMQQQELLNEIGRIIHHKGELIISAVTAGPHDRIVDPDLRNIWKDMHWRGNVKARHFVLALRDYCMDKLDKLRKGDNEFEDCEFPPMVTEQDEWTLEFINVTRLQAIIEAFDDDASGFITVAEANTFTTSRPEDWSLLHWMAYWAIGWQMAMTYYIVEIDTLLEKMFSLKSLVLPANRRFIEQYLHSTWSLITELTTGFRRAEWNDLMREKFQAYVSQQEKEMRGRLEKVRYDIDAADTLLLVTGPGRIEKHLFLILYLLLKRDFEIFRLARTTLLHQDELWDSANTLEWVFHAVHDRHHDLENLFKQQNHDPAQQFKVFAFEMFNYWHDPRPLWSFDRLRESRYITSIYSDEGEDPCVLPADILNHPVDNAEDPLSIPSYIASLEDQKAQGPVHAILGHWCGFLGQDMLYPSEPMLSLDIHAATSKPNQFIASGSIPSGTRWKLVGMVKRTDEQGLYYTFMVTYTARHWPKRFRGVLSDDGNVFSGTWNCTSDHESGTFLLKRLSCEIMRFWPLASKLSENRPRALWKFAIRTVLDQVQRRLFARSRLEQRQKTRQHYLKLIRYGNKHVLQDGDMLQATQQCYLDMTPSEARYYCMIYEYRQRLAPKHYGVSCSHCRATISGARYICLDCHGPQHTLDLCEKKDCVLAIIGPDRRSDLASPHLPSHRLLKLRKVIHRHREFGGIYRSAHDALIRAEEALSDVTTVQSWETGDEPRGHRRFGSGTFLRGGSTYGTPQLFCASCKGQVSRPCWYCIECEDDTFICAICEADNKVNKGKHKPTHGLVLCQPPREESRADITQPAWLYEQMEALENKFDRMQRESVHRFDALEKKVDSLRISDANGSNPSSAERDLNRRIQRIEDLLVILTRKLGDRV